MAPRKNRNSKKNLARKRKATKRKANSRPNNQKVVWPYQPIEKVWLEKAEMKLFKPTLETVKLLSKGNFQTKLEYQNIENKLFEEIEVQIKIHNEKNITGIPFSIKIPKVLPIGGVNNKESYGLDSEIHIKNDKSEYVIPSKSISNFRTKYPAKPQIIEGLIKRIKTCEGIEDLAFYRIVVPVNDNHMIFPTDILSCIDNHLKFDTESWNRQPTIFGIPFMSTNEMFVSLEIKGHTFHFYGLRPLKSLIIDSTSKLNKSEFEKITQVIRLCFAFLIGKFYKDETFYLSSSHSNFSVIENLEYIVEDKSVISDNQLINPRLVDEFNRFVKTDDKKDLKNISRYFPATLFSDFCEKVLESNELLRCIELLITASGLENPVQQGALYSVSLETITELIKDEHIATLKPIKDKNVNLEFKQQMLNTLESFNDRIDEQGMKILRSKIENMNSPTNQDKLMKPFEIVGITLSDGEKKVLNSRNDYLHGNDPNKIGDKVELEINALNLHSLLGKLILKYIGYSGYFIHLPNSYLINYSMDSLKEIQKIDFEAAANLLKEHESTELSKTKAFKELKKSLGTIVHAVQMLETVYSDTIRII